MDFYKYFTKFKKLRLIKKLLLLLLVILIVVIFSNINFNKQEGLTNKQHTFDTKNGKDIYDDVYVNIYDDLVHNKTKNNYEVDKIINIVPTNNRTKLLDIGCGTGHHVNLFNKNNIPSIGIDISPAMIKRAKKNFPALNFKVCNALNTLEFQNETFSHITCLYFTIYYIKNKKLFFENCFNWLARKGVLIIHLVDIKNFDPIIPSASITSRKSNNVQRLTKSNVKANAFNYKSNFELNENIDSKSAFLSSPNAIFKETIKFKNSNTTRQNEHNFYMPTQSSILSIAKDVGFILQAQEEMKAVEYDYNYLYYLVKP